MRGVQARVATLVQYFDGMDVDRLRGAQANEDAYADEDDLACCEVGDAAWHGLVGDALAEIAQDFDNEAQEEEAAAGEVADEDDALLFKASNTASPYTRKQAAYALGKVLHAGKASGGLVQAVMRLVGTLLPQPNTLPRCGHEHLDVMTSRHQAGWHAARFSGSATHDMQVKIHAQEDIRGAAC